MPNETNRDDSSIIEDLLESFLRRVEAGEKLTINDFSAQHPEHASVLVELEAAYAATRIRLKQEGLDERVADSDPSLSEALSQIQVRAERYEIGSEIGAGGMGVVYQAWDRELRRDIAMKVLRTPVANRESGGEEARSVRRFLAEARITSRLEHPGIVPVHEIGSLSDGRLFYTMRLVEGISLRRVLDAVREQREGWTLPRAIDVVTRACETVGYAHAQGVIHRDLKPSNVMVGAFGEVYVMDWGIARALTDDDCRTERRVPPQCALDHRDDLLTLDGEVLGTPAYMAPEQGRGGSGAVDVRCDVYSLGAILYEMLSGRPPYTGRTPREILDKLRDTPPMSLSESQVRVPAALAAIVDRAMARDPAARYSSATGLGADLRAFRENRVVQAYEIGALAEARTWIRRNRSLAIALSTAVVILVAATIVSAMLARATRRANERMRIGNAVSITEQAIDELNRIETDPEAIRSRSESAADWWLAAAGAIVEGDSSDDGLPLPGLIELRAARDEVRARGVGRPSPDSYPRAIELEFELARLKWMRRILEATGSESQVEIARSEVAALSISPRDMNLTAWYFVDPRNPQFGSEFMARALAERACREAGSEEDRLGYRNTLAWALFQCGEFEAARKEDHSVRDEVLLLREQHPDKTWSDLLTLPVIEPAIRDWNALDRAEEARELAAHVANLQAEQAEYIAPSFASIVDEREYKQLADVIARVEGLSERLRNARRSLLDPDARARWSEAIDSLKHDPRFSGVTVRPQIGLLPIGQDPRSGLWEFGHIASGAVPRRGSTGEIEIDDRVGIVFVLLPPGTASVPDSLGRDRRSIVSLDAFFLSKYETTIAQWHRLTREWPRPFQLLRTLPASGMTWTVVHNAVEKVGFWVSLPTEAQWRHAAQAGMKTRFWCGDTFAQACRSENLGSKHNVNALLQVGSLDANPFGLYDMIGNVSEMISEPARCLAPPRSGDGARFDLGILERLRMGASMANGERSPEIERGSNSLPAGESNPCVGFRLARPLLP